jgi:hypothetical protein
MMTTLSTIADLSSGYPFRKKVESEEGGDILLIQIKDLDGVEGVSGAQSVALRNDGSKYTRYLLQEGDLLLQSRGSRHPVAVVEPRVRGIAATGLHTIRPDRTRVLPAYLAWWLNHPVSQAKLTGELARGTYVPFVSLRDLAEFLVPLPSPVVQRRIVEIDLLRQRECALSTRLIQLTRHLVDRMTLAAANKASEGKSS